jgi:pseudolysin
MISKKIIAVLFGLTMLLAESGWAARVIDLRTQSAPLLQSLVTHGTAMKTVNSRIDFKQTTHVRLQQTYAGHPVWGGDSIVHIPHGGTVTSLHTLQPLLQNAAVNKTTMDGVVYQGLEADLRQTPAFVFEVDQAQKALAQATQLYQNAAGSQDEIKDAQSTLMVYMDEANVAHWAFLVSFLVQPGHGLPAKPTYILDAVSFQIYKNWDNIQTMDNIAAGGYGGNKKIGKLVYDGVAADLPLLKISRDAGAKTCYLQNDEVIVENRMNDDTAIRFACRKIHPMFNQIYWDGDEDTVNDAYSPANDAFYAGTIIHAMYQQWYGTPVLVNEDGQPMRLIMRVHENMENAYWDGATMTFGDGGDDFYPLVSIGVGAHEISHGFTEQHSNLMYYGQPGALNESFSDMAAQAAEYYSAGTNNWKIGAEVLKGSHEALRYMDNPTRDCHGRLPGTGCSIDNMRDFNYSVDVHYSSGVYNKLFYLLATTPGWDTKKAFDIMVQANMYYWTRTTNFTQAACGIIHAAKDFNYDVNAVNNAISGVGINTTTCA